MVLAVRQGLNKKIFFFDTVHFEEARVSLQ